MNAVRKHLSRIKGGRLALAARPARVVTLAISDIPGDDPAAIASGPTVADPGTLADVQEILARYSIDLPHAASTVLAACDETPKEPPAQNTVRVVVAPSLALAAAARAASNAGIAPLVLGDAIEGESRELGIVMAGIARSVRRNGLPVKPPMVLLSGGETTVTIGRGRQAAAGATPNSYSALPSRRPQSRTCLRSQATATASTAPKTPQARSSRPIPLPARAPAIWMPANILSHMTVTASLPASATSFIPGRPAPTSTISEPF
jgi:glycerate-2-kinase